MSHSSKVFSLIISCGLLLGGIVCPLYSAPADTVRVVIDQDLPTPVQHAVDQLVDAFKQHKVDVATAKTVDLATSNNIIIGLINHSDSVDNLIATHRLVVPEPAESLLIARIPGNGNQMFLVTGRDTRGLAYAVYEVAEAIRLAPQGSDPLSAIREAKETPFLRVRSVTTQIFNQDVERIWYENEAYWHWFFGMLAKNRFNNYSLTFGHNTNYMIPPYAWMFEVPEYPDVRVKGMTEADRARNLKIFQRISEIAQEYGVDLTVGLWTQLPVVKVRVGLDYGPSSVENLPPGLAGGDYCAKGLNKLLKLCPAVRGVQLRMNLESGIPHDKQEEYYKWQFKAIATCGRPVRLDLRYKSLSQKTIDLAKNEGLDVTVSTKFWCEHMGLPFHPTWQDPANSASRYGYGTMLHHPRNYRVVYRLWNIGTSRLLLWGDPGYASRFALSCAMGGEGFEIFAPLGFKGYGNEPGDWQIFADRSLKSYQWEYERYWAYFLTFGRYGYNPDTPLTVWQRELQGRFGKAGSELDEAYRQASQVLPVITATTQFSVCSWRFWPEMLPCMHLDAYRAIQPSDFSQFYAIAPWSSRQNWRSEGCGAKHSAFVEDAIANNLNSKCTPIEVSQYLNEIADTTLVAIEKARSVSKNVDSAEFRATELDLRVLAHLARYHAAKKLAATHLEFFRLTNDKARLLLVWKHIKDAQAEWEAIVTLTDGKYYNEMVFGFSKKHYCDFPDRVQYHIGHWKDRLAEVKQDVKFVADLLQKNEVDPSTDMKTVEQTLKRFPGEVPLKLKPVITHNRKESAKPGKDLEIIAQVSSSVPLRNVSVYYRQVDQTQAWRRITMKPTENGSYSATIPGSEVSSRFDFQYYLEARVAQGGTFWPNWQHQTPYVVVKVQR